MLKETGLYVHIPFCIKKCRYCDFNSFCGTEEQKDLYTEALIKEIVNMERYTKDRFLNTIFFGGGTPSVLGRERIKKIINRIKTCFYIDDDTEFTIECNPKTVNLGDFKEYKELGVNRISLGVQSMQDSELELIGRSHSLNDFLECVISAKLAGFENISFDLMFSLPSQTLKSLENTITDAIKLQPKHISAYSLQLEEGTYLFENREQFDFPDEEENRKMYYLVRDILKENGYNQYEISNFAQEGFESRHNIKYWELKDYIGLGLGSSSFLNNVRYQNPENFSDYIEFTNNFSPLWEENEPESEKDLMGEFMFLGLRKTKGVLNSEFKRFFNKDMFEIYSPVINKFLSSELLKTDGEALFLTEKGMDLSNTVMCEFV